MNQFTIESDGKVSDEAIVKTLEHLRGDLPRLDESAVEVHMAFFRAYAVCRASLAGQYEGLGFSIPRLNTLRHLYQAGEAGMTMTELSAYLEASVPSTMRLVSVLEAEGLLRRSTAEHDRRVTFVHLTEAGLETMRELLPSVMDIWSELWSSLNDMEKRTLSHLLAKVRMNLLSRFIGYESLLPYKIEARRGARRHGSGKPPARSSLEAGTPPESAGDEGHGAI
jgi:DNA-binding MarR family transcriptional regulator